MNEIESIKENIRNRVRAALDAIPKKPETLEAEIFRFVTDQWGEKSGLDIGLKLSEETGEVCGAIVRVNQDRGTVDQIADELGDALIVASQLAFLLGGTIEQIRADRWEQVKSRK